MRNLQTNKFELIEINLCSAAAPVRDKWEIVSSIGLHPSWDNGCVNYESLSTYYLPTCLPAVSHNSRSWLEDSPPFIRNWNE